MIAEYDNGAAPAAPSREYIYSRGVLLATIEGGVTKYHHQDQLSVRLTTDSTGTTIGQQGHYPYGEAWYASGTTTKWQFTSYERDAESGNDYAMFRHHVNRLGRFSSADPLAGPISNPQSLDRYAYVVNDPPNLIDPLGLFIYIGPGSPRNPYVPFGSGGGGFPFDKILRDLFGEIIGSAIARASDALKNPKCRNLFGPNVDPVDLLQKLEAGNAGVGSIQARDLGGPSNGAVTAASTQGILGSRYVPGPNGTTIRQSMFSGATITINSNSQAPFWNGYGSFLSFLGSYDNATQRAATIIHELGHVADILNGPNASALVDDQGSSLRDIANTINVLLNCF